MAGVPGIVAPLPAHQVKEIEFLIRDPDRKLLLIRHSLPEPSPERPADQWPLSQEGRFRCEFLAQKLAPYRLDRLVCSPEPKALATGQIVARLLGLPVETAFDLREHSRKSVPFLSEADLFRARVESVFRNPSELVFGDETGDETLLRFTGAIKEIITLHQTGNLGVVSHGTAMALYVSHMCVLDASHLWRRLGMPSFVVLADAGTRCLEVVEEVGAVR